MMTEKQNPAYEPVSGAEECEAITMNARLSVMKRSEIYFSAVQVPVDYAMIVLSAISVFLLRDFLPEVSDILSPKLYDLSLDRFVELAFLVAPLFLVVYALEGLYVIRATRRFWQEAFDV